MSTESSWNDETYKITCGLQLLPIDSVDMEPHSCGLSQCKASLSVDSIDGESHSTSTQCAEDEKRQCKHTKPSVDTFKGTTF